MIGNGDAICVFGQKIKDTSELEMNIPENAAELMALCVELISLIEGSE
ncbi:hypothetical protein [Ruegeria denitrificans]